MTTEKTITAYKGFNLDMTCRGYQFKVGETYTHAAGVEACKSGFHSCENPLDVFGYYPPSVSAYCRVQASGEISRHADDSKIASGVLHVQARITLPDLITRAFEWVRDHCSPATSEHATGDQSASSATGYQSASSATGDQSASSATGDRSASSATGYQSASSATGDQSASSATGYQSASSATGDRSASSATGYRSASSATGYQSASSATGDRSASSATGDQSASLTTGPGGSSEITPDRDAKSFHAVAIATGYQSRARAPKGSAIVLVERNDEGEIIAIKASLVGKNGVKPDTWYTLKGGKFVAWSAS